jgi:hypothetical protein
LDCWIPHDFLFVWMLWPMLDRYQVGTLVYRLVLHMVSKNQQHWLDPRQYQPGTSTYLVLGTCSNTNFISGLYQFHIRSILHTCFKWTKNQPWTLN